MTKALALLITTCLLVAGCSDDGSTKLRVQPASTATTPAPEPEEGTIRFPGDGVRVETAADVDKLAPAPQAFRDFIAAEVARTDPQCDLPRIIHVEAVDMRGLAVGAVNECGGYIAVWGRDKTGWRELFGTQAPGPCPSDLAGFTAEDITELADGELCDNDRPAPEQVKTDAPATVKSGEFAVGQTAHFSYFDVTVLDHRRASNGVEGGGIYGALIKVCYTRRHPGANADGATRTSRDPWRFGLAHGPEPVWDRGSKQLSHRWKPMYTERKLKVGECNSGWLTTDIRETAYVAHIGMRYAPADFDFRGTWTW